MITIDDGILKTNPPFATATILNMDPGASSTKAVIADFSATGLPGAYALNISTQSAGAVSASGGARFL
jgi:hypothetical protein